MEKKEKVFTSLLNGVGDFLSRMAGVGGAVNRSKLFIEPRLWRGSSLTLRVARTSGRR